MSSDPQDNYILLSVGILLPLAVVSTIAAVLAICEVTVLNAANSSIQASGKHSTMDILVRITIVCCSIFSTLCIWCDLVRHCICFLFNKDLYYFPLNNIMGIADLFYYFSTILFYLIATIRLQLLFLGSKYSVHKCILFILYCFIITTLLLSIYYAIIVFLTPNIDNTSYWNYYDKIPMIVIGGMDFILNTSLLILFIIKVNQLLATTLLYCDVKKLSQPHSGIYTMSSNLLIVITRHSILFSFAIIINQIWYIIVLIQMNYNIKLYVTTFCFRALQCCSNCIILVLSFNRNLSAYMCCCGCCHKSIQRCFECCIKAQLRRNNKFVNDNTLSLIPHNFQIIEDTSYIIGSTETNTSKQTNKATVTTMSASIQ